MAGYQGPGQAGGGGLGEHADVDKGNDAQDGVLHAGRQRRQAVLLRRALRMHSKCTETVGGIE